MLAAAGNKAKGVEVEAEVLSESLSNLWFTKIPGFSVSHHPQQMLLLLQDQQFAGNDVKSPPTHPTQHAQVSQWHIIRDVESCLVVSTMWK